MGKNGELSPTRRAIIVEIRIQKKKFKNIANQVNANKTLGKQAFYNWKKFETFKSSPRFGDLELQIINLINKFKGLLKWTEKKKTANDIRNETINFIVRNRQEKL